jgi:hypothetical protein
MYMKESMSVYNRDTCTLMIISVLFTIAKLKNRTMYPSTDEWIKKMWYTYTMKYYSAVKKNESMSFVEKWMELKIIGLCEISYTQKNKYHIFSCGM